MVMLTVHKRLLRYPYEYLHHRSTDYLYHGSSGAKLGGVGESGKIVQFMYYNKGQYKGDIKDELMYDIRSREKARGSFSGDHKWFHKFNK